MHIGVWMKWIELVFLVIEYLAVGIIAGMVIYCSAKYFISFIAKRNTPDVNYRVYKHTLGRALLLGLEILVAADVIRTVALEPSLENIASLGLLVVVRTLLSWSQFVEIEGRWPWQPDPSVVEPSISPK